jgi:hypothetical protein
MGLVNKVLAALAVIVLLLVSYVLSVGPAYWLAWHEYLPADVVQPVYAPLGPVVDNVGGKDALNWYVRYCMFSGNPPPPYLGQNARLP